MFLENVQVSTWRCHLSLQVMGQQFQEEGASQQASKSTTPTPPPPLHSIKPALTLTGVMMPSQSD